MNEPFSRHPSAAVISATPRASHGLKGLSAWHAERLFTLPGRVTARPRESPAGVAFVGARTSKPASSSSLQPQEPRVRLAVGSLWNLHLRARAAQAADSTATRAVSIHPHKHSTSSSPSSSQPCRRPGQPASSSRVESSGVELEFRRSLSMTLDRDGAAVEAARPLIRSVVAVVVIQARIPVPVTAPFLQTTSK